MLNGNADSAEHAKSEEEDMPDRIFVRWIACFVTSLGLLFILFSSPTLIWTGQVAIYLINNHIPAQFTLAFIIGIDAVAVLAAWTFAAPVGDWLTLKIFKIDMKPWNDS